MKRLGLADEAALQGWFTDPHRTVPGIAHGRRTIGWDDILKGGAALPADAAVVSWHLDGAAMAAAPGPRRGDRQRSDPLLRPPAVGPAQRADRPGRGGLAAGRLRHADPRRPSLSAEQRAHIIGVQANLWTEHMPSEHDVALMAFPRAAAVAEFGWTAPERKDWADFQARLPAELARDRALGLAADDEVARAKQDAALEAVRPGRLASQQLALCTQKVALNLQAPLASQQGQRYLVDIMNPCWIYPQADLSARSELRVAVTRLPFNFQLGADAAKIALRPPKTPAGELEVRADGCGGAPVAALPLARAAASDGVTVLAGDLPRARRPPRPLLHLHRAAARSDVGWLGWAASVRRERRAHPGRAAGRLGRAAGRDAGPGVRREDAGRRVAIDPTLGELRAPCDGEVIGLHDSPHAVTLRAVNGAEVLLHVGLETVKLLRRGVRGAGRGRR